MRLSSAGMLGAEMGMWAPIPLWQWDVSPGGMSSTQPERSLGQIQRERKRVKLGMQHLVPPGRCPCREEGRCLQVLQTHHNLSCIPGPSNPCRTTEGRTSGGSLPRRGSTWNGTEPEEEEEVLPARRKS